MGCVTASMAGRSGLCGRGDLSHAEWARLTPHSPKNVGRGGRWKARRKVINGVLFRQRTGIPWWDLPLRFGKWKQCTIPPRIRVPRPQGGHPRTHPDHVGGDRAYSSRRNRRSLRGRQIRHTIPEPTNQRANRQRRGSLGGRPAGFDKERYARRNEVERTINRLKVVRAVATRFDKRAHVFHGTVTVAAIRLRLRS